MTGETEWDSRSVWLALVHTKEEEESRKIYDIAQAPKVRELNNAIIMGRIVYLFLEQAMNSLHLKKCLRCSALVSKRRSTHCERKHRRGLDMWCIHYTVDIEWIIFSLTGSTSIISSILTTYWTRLSLWKETQERGFIRLVISQEPISMHKEFKSRKYSTEICWQCRDTIPIEVRSGARYNRKTCQASVSSKSFAHWPNTLWSGTVQS